MRSAADPSGQRGSAVVEFALVVPLLVAVMLAVFELGAWVVRRQAAQDAAFTAARAGARTFGATADRLAAAVQAARAEHGDARGPIAARVASVGGLDSVVVEIGVPLRLLAAEVPVAATVSAHAAIEPQ